MSKSSSSSANPQGASATKLRRSAFTSTLGKNYAALTKHEGALGAVLDILFHVQGFYDVLKEAEPLDMIGTEDERRTFGELKKVFKQMADGAPEESIDLTLFLRMMIKYSAVQFEGDMVDIMGVWDTVVRLIVVVIPPLREIFLGHITNSRERMETPGWLNIMSRSFRARYSTTCNNLDDACQGCYTSVSEKHLHGTKNSVQKSTQTANAMVLRRAPDFFVASVESSHLDELLDKFETQKKQLSNGTPPANAAKGSSGGENAKKKPADEGKVSAAAARAAAATAAAGIDGPRPNDSAPAGIQIQRDLNLNRYAGKTVDDEGANTREYELSTVVALQGDGYDDMKVFLNTGSTASPSPWHALSVARGKASRLQQSSEVEATSPDLYAKPTPSSDSGAAASSRSHPRILIYTRKNIADDFKRTRALVTKAGQMKALGDVAFALTQTISNYQEAKQYYEEAIRLDESYREPLKENLATLEIFDRTMRARNLEEQADLALANRRFKEASENYTTSMKTSLEGSRIYHRVKEKKDSVSTVLDLEMSQQLVGQGETALKNSQFSRAQELYSRALRLNPDLIHLQCILQGIEKTMQTRAASSKISDAYASMKLFHYKEANALFREAIGLDATVEESIQEVMSTLGPLMKGEDALNKQRQGQQCLEDKQYDEAIAAFSEGTVLLPPNAAKEHASILADRSQVHLARNEFENAIEDCSEALRLCSDLAVAHFRIGAAYFGMESFDEAVSAYEKAVRHDPSLGDLVKAKIRQVTSAREVLLRKIREEERAREKAAQEALLKEKREKEEKARKERVEKAAADKAERNRLKEIEKQDRAAKQKEDAALAASAKEAEAQRKKKEKAEEKERKTKERELAKVEKEKEREKARKEKERQAEEAAAARQEELRRQQEKQEEQDRLRAVREEKERAAEAAKEKARLERERIIEERRLAREAKEKEKEGISLGAHKPAANSTSNGSSSSSSSSSSSNSISSNSISASGKEDPPLGVGVKKRPSSGAGSLSLSGLSIGQKQATPASTGTSSSSAAAAAATATATASGLSALSGAGAGAGGSWGQGVPGFASAVVSNDDFPALGEPSVSASASASASAPASGGLAQGAGAYGDHPGLSSLGASPSLGGLTGPVGVGPGLMGGGDGINSELSANTPSFVYNPQKPATLLPPNPHSGVGVSGDGGITGLPDLGSSLSAALGAAANASAGAGPASSAVDAHRAFSAGLGTGGLGLFSAGAPSVHASSLPLGADKDTLGGDGDSTDAFGLGVGSSAGRIGSVDIGGSLGGLGGTGVRGAGDSGSDPLLDAIGGLSSNTLGSSLLSSLGAFDDDPFSSSLGTGGASGVGGVGDSDGGLGHDILGGGGMLGDLHSHTTSNPGHRGGPSLHAQQQQHQYQQHPHGMPGAGAAAGAGDGPVSSLSMMMNANAGKGGLKGGLGDFDDHSSFLRGGPEGNTDAYRQQHHQHHHHHQQQQQQHMRSPHLAPAPPGPPGAGPSGGSSSAGTGEGIDKDVVRPERCREMFPSIAWLSNFGLPLYHWSGDHNEWTAYALFLPQEFVPVFLANDGARLKEFRERSRCSMWIDKEKLRGKEETFLVLHRGASGQPSNIAMNTALDLVSALMRQVIGQQQQQQQQQTAAAAATTTTAEDVLILPSVSIKAE